MNRRVQVFGFLAGCLVSATGTAMSAVAIPWLVLVTTGSAARTGVVGFAEMAPFVLIQATAGPFADRVGYRRANVAGNLIAAIVLGAVPILHAAGALRFGELALLVAVGGSARGLAEAASNPLVPALGSRAGMPMERVAAWFSATNRIGLLVGMPLGGALIGVFGPAAVVAFDAASFAIIAVSVLAVVPHRLGVVDEPVSERSYVDQLKEGLRFLLGDRLMLGMVALIAVTNLLDQALASVLLPVWAHTRVHDATALGAVGGVTGFGLLVGIFVGGWLGPRLPRRVTYIWGNLISMAPPFVALALSATLPVVLPVIAVAGIAGGVLNPINSAVLYERTPEVLRARVLGAVKASAWVGIPFGSLLGGALASAAGLTIALLACAAIMLIATLAPFRFPIWHEMNRVPEFAPL